MGDGSAGLGSMRAADMVHRLVVGAVAAPRAAGESGHTVRRRHAAWAATACTHHWFISILDMNLAHLPAPPFGLLEL